MRICIRGSYPLQLRFQLMPLFRCLPWGWESPAPPPALAVQSVAQEHPDPNAHAEACCSLTALAAASLAEVLLDHSTPIPIVGDNQTWEGQADLLGLQPSSPPRMWAPGRKPPPHPIPHWQRSSEGPQPDDMLLPHEWTFLWKPKEIPNPNQQLYTQLKFMAQNQELLAVPVEIASEIWNCWCHQAKSSLELC